MQQSLPKRGPTTNFNNKGNGRTQIILILALALFSFSGLAVGFATGAFKHLNMTPQQAQKHVNTPPIAHTTTPTPLPTQTTIAQDIPLGCPIPGINSNTDANGNITYTFSVQAAEDQVLHKCDLKKPGNAIQAADITCKVLLMPIPANQIVTFPNTTFDTATIQQPLPGEIQNGLIFDQGTPQVQTSNGQGQASWQFTISPTVQPGDYYVVVVTARNGNANWSWVQIKKPK